MPVVGTTGTKIATPQCVWRASMQRQLGLHLSEVKPALVELAENGETVDFSGGDASNNANHNRGRHNACFTAWYNAISAVRVATTQTVLGDKAHGALTKQFNDFNDGHVVDIAEIGSGDSGEDTCVEVKVFSSLTKSCGTGRGGVNGGTTAAVGHKYTASATPRSRAESPTFWLQAEGPPERRTLQSRHRQGLGEGQAGRVPRRPVQQEQPCRDRTGSISA